MKFSPLVALRVRTVFLALALGLLAPRPGAFAALPDYKLGDVASEDVTTPVPLLVVNPEATEALRQKVAAQAPFIVRHTPQSALEAETELRAAIAAVRSSFLTMLRAASQGRAPGETASGPALVAAATRDIARDAPKDLPLDQLAPLWAREQGDQAIIEGMLQPLRDVMAQPIVTTKDNSFPQNQPVRLVTVKSANDVPTLADMENPSPAISPGKVITLWRARRLVETSFPAGQEQMGRFAASFVRANAFADPAATELLRAKRMEGVTANDTYEAAQVIVRKGQTIDRKALSALTALREKSLIGTLQTKLEQEQTVATQIKKQTKWIGGIFGVVAVVLILIFWRLRATRPSTALVTLPGQATLMDASVPALPGSAADPAWRERALVAEGKAERAHEAIRSGVLGWMREQIMQTLFRHRTELLAAQRSAEAEMHELEQRLEQLHTPLQERIAAYERRIAELERDLVVKGEENRELIGARISAAKLMVERGRKRFGVN